MITCRLKGGLANMMFQIAAIEWLAKQHGFETYYPTANNHLRHLNSETKHNPKLRHAMEYKTIFKNFSWPTKNDHPKLLHETIPWQYTPIVPKDNVCYDGFFQCSKYFDEDFTQWLFSPSDDIQNQIKERYEELFKLDNICALHVRRGDYLNLRQHPTQSMEYFNAAMENINANTYIIFSDDILWCKKNFKGNQYHFIEDVDYIELFLQARCDHNIISNSSFSWWGAYLNPKKNKRVMAPKLWFESSKYDDKDIIPKEWKRL